MLQAKIIIIPSKKLVGMRMQFSLSKNTPAQLWRQFMPRRREIKNNINEDLISMEIYDGTLDVRNFNGNTVFEKWAVVEVSDFDDSPEGMETYLLKGGKYAVFLHKASERPVEELFDYIFKTWLPAAEFELDNRAHFGVMGEKYYGPENPNTEEEIWVPIKRI